MYTPLLFVAFLVLLLNLPFGYWRANVRKFSFAWFLSVHAPVPFVIALRMLSGLGFHLSSLPIMLVAYFSGQLLGGRLHDTRMKKADARVSSCLVWDLVGSGRRS